MQGGAGGRTEDIRVFVLLVPGLVVVAAAIAATIAPAAVFAPGVFCPLRLLLLLLTFLCSGAHARIESPDQLADKWSSAQ